ncbi:putative phosphatidate phosphatase isoform X3 [Cimex lectularius]|uniref:Phosphatidic acid phosphatase type 2/haloperoxidase domain-containing protein n=1 Tax=Cimex lectularius TaxID=79782 RepID=A0A8I6RQZ6_CIMLE|nr:putative phosphatidate phosphatase isoform X3 [Cimex lectularius]
MDSETKKILTRVSIDFLCLVAVGVPSLYLHLFAQPYQRGFFCDDMSIRYPFKQSTVSTVVLYFIGLGLPIIVMILLEVLLVHRRKNAWSPTFIFGKRIPVWVINSYKTVGVFCFGALCNVLVTDVAKYTIGRLRPHFFDICKPDIDCNAAMYKQKYITEFICTSKDNTSYLKDSRLSFPSGHSSFAAFTMVYLALYLQVRFQWQGSFLLKRFFQLCCVIMAWCTALSRVSDYKHHWSDVLVGLFIGTTVSFLTVLYVSQLFDKHKTPFNFHQSGAVSSASNQAMVEKQDLTIQDGVHAAPVELLWSWNAKEILFANRMKNLI